MFKRLARFHDDESGAVTVDWVVLTGAALILGMVVAVPIGRSAVGLSEEAGSTLSAAEVPQITWPE